MFSEHGVLSRGILMKKEAQIELKASFCNWFNVLLLG
jgi:hypothetical protein